MCVDSVGRMHERGRPSVSHGDAVRGPKLSRRRWAGKRSGTSQAGRLPVGSGRTADVARRRRCGILKSASVNITVCDDVGATQEEGNSMDVCLWPGCAMLRYVLLVCAGRRRSTSNGERCLLRNWIGVTKKQCSLSKPVCRLGQPEGLPGHCTCVQPGGVVLSMGLSMGLSLWGVGRRQPRSQGSTFGPDRRCASMPGWPQMLSFSSPVVSILAGVFWALLGRFGTEELPVGSSAAAAAAGIVTDAEGQGHTGSGMRCCTAALRTSAVPSGRHSAQDPA